MRGRRPRRGIETAGDQHAATADNTVDNQPEKRSRPEYVAFRDATISKTTRDRLAELSAWCKARGYRNEHTGDGVFAIDEVVARWDANDETEITAPDESFLTLEYEDAPAVAEAPTSEDEAA